LFVVCGAFSEVTVADNYGLLCLVAANGIGGLNCSTGEGKMEPPRCNIASLPAPILQGNTWPLKPHDIVTAIHVDRLAGDGSSQIAGEKGRSPANLKLIHILP
jgi:hypothetical protein